jgi:hypothetical protein
MPTVPYIVTELSFPQTGVGAECVSQGGVVRFAKIPVVIVAICVFVSSVFAATPTYLETVQVPSDAEGYAVVIADFNRDGKPDMAVSDYTGSAVSILLGSATGFGTPVKYGTGSRPQGVAIADFNRDGNLDLAVANSGESA